MENVVHKKRYIKLSERTPENDIKYKAPLSYRYIRIIGWACLVIAQIAMVVKFNIKLMPESESQIGWLRDVGSSVSALPLPLFLLANFAIIFQKKQGTWRNLLMFYGGVALALYIVGNVVIIHYGYGFVRAFVPDVDFWNMAKAFGLTLFSLGQNGLVFNIFIDLLLCSLIYFFLNYKPKCFKEKNIIYFRLLVILPILYEVASILIKFFVSNGAMDIPFMFFFLLTSKPPLMFVAFVALVFVLKFQEVRAAKKENTKLLEENRKTNAHVFHFSLVIALIFLIAGVLDIIIYYSATLSIASWLLPETNDPAVIENYVKHGVYVTESMGFGKAAILILVAPIALLFSYKKSHKNKKIDILVPVAGLALMVFVYVEGMFQVLVHNIPIVIQRIADFIKSITE